MSKENYTHIISIIDRSGSMNSIRKDMEGGFDNFVNEQKEVEGAATLTLVQFDTQYEVVYDNTNIIDVPNFSLQPRGGTALLDAIGKTLTTERERINNMEKDDKPEKVVCIVITDGQENASTEYNRDRIFKMISDLEREEDTQWDFVFLGANQDAIAEGGSMGISRSKSFTYDASAVGTQAAFETLSRSMKTYRCSEKGVNYSFDEKDRSKQDDSLKHKKHNQAIPSYITDLASVIEENE
jgi:uncharacterized protein YegL